MRYLLYLTALLALASCGSRDHATATATHAAADTLAGPPHWRPEAFLDSVGQLPAAPLVARATQYADSLFTHQPQLNRVVGEADMALLRRAGQTGWLKLADARRVFGDDSLTNYCNTDRTIRHAVQARRVLLGPRGTDEYALCVGEPSYCASAAMYFFKGNKLIARHQTPYRNGQSLRYYRDAEGHAVVYYLTSFESGSGIWWHQYFFYRYEGERLVPVLNTLQNGNLRPGWGLRAYWLEATLQKTNPLTLKLVYNVELPDTASTGPFLLRDSTLVAFRRNPATGRLEGQYAAASITQAQALSYYVQNNDMLFVNAHYARLKQALADPALRTATRRYRWAVRRYYGRPRVPVTR